METARSLFRRVEQERRNRRLLNPLKYRTWHEIQDVVLCDTRKTVAAIGGNWSGKSSLNKLITAGLLQHEFPVPGVIEIPNRPLNMWMISDPLVFSDSIQGGRDPLERYLPLGAVQDRSKESSWGCDKYWKLKTGDTIRFISWGKENMEGPEIDVALFDEPPPYDVWDAVMSRLRGEIKRDWYFFTPLAAASDIYDIFDGSDPHKVGIHNMPIWANCKCLAGLPEEKLARLGKPLELAKAKHPDNCRCNKGYKSQQEIFEYLDKFKGMFLEAREWGLWLFQHRRIYQSMSRDAHVISRQWMQKNWCGYYPREGCVYVGLDPHGQYPDFVDISVMQPNGTMVQVDELPNFYDGEFKGIRYHEIRNYHRPIIETCKQLIARLKTIDLPINDMLIDPHYASKNERSVEFVTKMVDLFNQGLRDLKWTASRFRLHTPDKDDIMSVDTGHRLINGLLTTRNRLQPDHFMLMWSELCENSIYSFLNYRTVGETKKEGAAPSEKPEEKHKHASDVKRYIFSARPRYYVHEGNIRQDLRDFKTPAYKPKESEEFNYAV